MRIEELWQELEKEALTRNPAAWLTRFALPQPSTPLLIALETSSSRRALLLPLPLAAIPARHEWPSCKGLEVFSIRLEGEPHFGVRLRNSEYADIFTAFAEDVAPRVTKALNPNLAASTLLARLRRWQKFLSAGAGGLSPERQKGLFGELHFLYRHIISAFGPELSVTGWQAPTAAHQDFQFATGSVEVKATAAKQPQAVRITSERQLDETGMRALFLHVVVLDEREVQPGKVMSGESLPEMVEKVRAILHGHDSAIESFEDKLLDAGYLSVDVYRYGDRRFSLRREDTYQVTGGFPRLVERSLPNGVGDVSYALSLSACQPYTVSVQEMLSTLTQPG